MNPILYSKPLAVANDTWIFAHDIMGVIALAILMGFAVFFKRKRNWPIEPTQNAPGDVGLRRMVRRAQGWALFLVIAAVTIFFFFIYPRVTSFEAQAGSDEKMNPSGTRPTRAVE